MHRLRARLDGVELRCLSEPGVTASMTGSIIGALKDKTAHRATMARSPNSDFNSPGVRMPRPVLDLVREDIERDVLSLLRVPDDPRQRLYRAMLHGVTRDTRRLAPLLLFATADLFAVDRAEARRVGLALECINIYSAIHEDLQVMGNRARRHDGAAVQDLFGDAAAILAGDCLHAMAFEILSDPATLPDPLVRAELVLLLAKTSGPAGIAGAKKAELNARLTARKDASILPLRSLRSGALAAAAVEAGAIMAQAAPEQRNILRLYARNIGLACQLAETENDGVYSDIRTKMLTRSAIRSLECFDSKANSLREFAKNIS